jgi:hypothetical protein
MSALQIHNCCAFACAAHGTNTTLKRDHPKVIDALEHGGDRRSHGFQATSSSLKYGGNPGYLAARFKRDAPAIAEALDRGEYPSGRGAQKNRRISGFNAASSPARWE